jgi:hypothetical protein
MFKVLKKGGYWINLGPLLYHFSDIPGDLFIFIRLQVCMAFHLTSYAFLAVSFVSIQNFILKMMVIAFKLYDQIKKDRLDVQLYPNTLSK